MWCLPAKQDASFVAAMEDVLDVYERAYDPSYPVVCLDETSKQLVGEVRDPIPASPGHPERIDAEYVRNGTANLFIAVEPLGGWRHVEVTDTRTRVDFARFVKELVDGQYKYASKVVLVMDNLNTHSVASLYEAFTPAEAKRIADKLEIHYTPKHGSWLNMAECELGILGRQCLHRRIPEKQLLASEVLAWKFKRNESAACTNWQFTTADARIKLKRLYPKLD
jgi:hypothetical protein